MSGNGAPPLDHELDAFAELGELPAYDPPPLSPELAAELDALAPVATRRPWRQLGIAAAISLVYGAIVLAIATTRRDLAHLPHAWLATFATAWLLGFALPLQLTLVPRRGGMMPRWQLGGALAALAAVGFVAAGFLFPRTVEGSVHRGLASWAGCLSVGLAAALVPVVIGTLLLRGAAPVGSRLTAAALGAAGGGLGGLVLLLHCPITDGVHVGIVHGGVVSVAALLAAALVAPRLAPRLPPRR